MAPRNPGPLCRAVAEGRAASPAELKRLWRVLARATHPDTRPGADPQAFRSLADDYAAARRLLETPRGPAGGPRPSPEPRPELPDLVGDLTASGFPAPDRARRTSAAYRKRLDLLGTLWRDRGGDPDRLRTELEALGEGGPPAKRHLDEFREFLYLVTAYRHHRFAYVRAQLDRAAPELQARCEARGDAETARFVAALAVPKGG